jgi:flavin-binding protein dodecin
MPIGVTQVTGSSAVSFSDAVLNAISQANIRNATGFNVANNGEFGAATLFGTITDGKVEFQATIDIQYPER